MRIIPTLLAAALCSGCGTGSSTPSATHTPADVPPRAWRLLVAVTGVERRSGSKPIDETKRAIVEEATPNLLGAGLDDFSTPIRHPEHPALRVLVRRERVDVEGATLNVPRDIIVVEGHNYWWKFIPVLEHGRVRSFDVQASPICRW